jgi:hypothetical protein
MYINRGNHEAKDMNRSYGFEGEAKHKHGEQTYKARFPFTCGRLCSLIGSVVRACVHDPYVAVFSYLVVNLNHI